MSAASHSNWKMNNFSFTTYTIASSLPLLETTIIFALLVIEMREFDAYLLASRPLIWFLLTTDRRCFQFCIFSSCESRTQRSSRKIVYATIYVFYYAYTEIDTAHFSSSNGACAVLVHRTGNWNTHQDATIPYIYPQWNDTALLQIRLRECV